MPTDPITTFAGQSGPSTASSLASRPAGYRSRSRQFAAGSLLAAAVAVGAFGCSKAEEVKATPTVSGPPATSPGTPRGTTTGTVTPSQTEGTGTTVKKGTTSTTDAGKGTSTTNKSDSSSTTGKVVTPASAAVFCATFLELDKTMSGLDPDKDAATFFPAARKAFKALLADAPDELKPDLQALSDAYANVNTAEELGALSGDAKLGTALDNLSKFTETNCAKP